MQIKKEILLFFSLVLLCITLITAADFTKDSVVSCDPKANPEQNCCKTEPQKGVNASPWNFITQGILHLIG